MSSLFYFELFHYGREEQMNWHSYIGITRSGSFFLIHFKLTSFNYSHFSLVTLVSLTRIIRSNQLSKYTAENFHQNNYFVKIRIYPSSLC